MIAKVIVPREKDCVYKSLLKTNLSRTLFENILFLFSTGHSQTFSICFYCFYIHFFVFFVDGDVVIVNLLIINLLNY